MPTRYPNATSNYRRDTTSARKLRQDAAPCGVFRCDRCDRVLPETLLVLQDGYALCRTLCADETSVTENRVALAAQLAEVDSYAPNADPPSSAFDGAVAITSHTDFPVRLRASLTPVAVSFVGVGFTSDIAISYSNAEIGDASAPVITATTIDLSIQAVGSLADGYYNITIAGKAYVGAILATECA